MAKDDNWCGHDCDGGFCFCRLIRIVVGIVLFLVILSIVFWTVSGAIGLVLGGSWVGFYGWTWIPQLIVFIVVFWLVLWLLRIPFRMSGYGGGYGRHEMRILRRRYARGEISETQFKRMRKNLMERQ